ncbi:MAG: SpoVR family protein [Symbiobacterium sp.]|uniref:SpoVR family protein n=1 Tax=Symbiobacterium sp. TaxID=1971213 RepID=UPI0034639309
MTDSATGRALPAADLKRLEAAIEEIMALARAHGLDFFTMRFEICPAEVLYAFGAYGMPTRFSHWSFGKAYYLLKSQADLGLARIYELVINSDPCYAFLLESNTFLENRMVVAHVLGHSDFFKHNWRFRGTNRKMVDTMSAFADRVRQYEQRYGRDVVERFLDAAMAVAEQVDPFPGTRPDPRSDLPRFLLERAADLADWQRDILASLREEALYFRPQMETKILNEGWASLWHARIMRQLELTPAEAVEFARLHAAVLAPNPAQLNPYRLGYALLESIEARYGRERLFEVRSVETDVSLVRNYLTPELCAELDLQIYAREGDGWETQDTDWTAVRDTLLRQLENCGLPRIYAEDDNYRGRGELFLRHGYDGVELDVTHLTHALQHVQHIWGRPVHLETVHDGERALYTCDSAGNTSRVL